MFFAYFAYTIEMSPTLKLETAPSSKEILQTIEHICAGELRELKLDVRASVQGVLVGDHLEVIPTEGGFDFHEDGEYSRTYTKDGLLYGLALAA